MTEEDIAVRLTSHEHEIKSLKHRMQGQEETSSQINDIVISIREVALNMSKMLEEQKILSSRIKILEDKPAQTWGTITQTAITAVISALAGGIAVWFVQGLALHMH